MGPNELETSCHRLLQGLFLACLGHVSPSSSQFGAPRLSPIFLLVHLLRFYMSEKYQLLMDLKHFDLRKVFCRTEFDKNFIYSAISDWYGSEDAFMRYVRGPLREELLTQGTTEIPVGPRGTKRHGLRGSSRGFP